MMGTYLESELIHDRAQIRESKRLNALLEDNLNAIQTIFEKYANSNVSKSVNKGSYNLTRKKFITVDQAIEIFMLCKYNLQEKAKEAWQAVKGAGVNQKSGKSLPKKQSGKSSPRKQSILKIDNG